MTVFETYVSHPDRQSTPKYDSVCCDSAWLLSVSLSLAARPTWFPISQGTEGGGDPETPTTAGLWHLQTLPLFCLAFPEFQHLGAKSTPWSFPGPLTHPHSLPQMPLWSLFSTPVTFTSNVCISPWWPSFYIDFLLFLVSSWSFPKNFSYASGIFR